MTLKFAANIHMMFTEVPSFPDRYEAARKAGFKAVESLFLPAPSEFSIEELAAARAKSGLKHTLMSSYPGDLKAGDLGIAALPGRKKEFRDTFDLCVENCKALECNRMHVMSGKIPSHDAGQRSKLLSDMEDTLVENLKFAAERVKNEDIVVVIEPINDVYTIPNYFLTRFEQAMRVIGRVGSDKVKLQFDIFHLQIISGNLTKMINEYMPHAGYVQLAQVPGKTEPSMAGEIDFNYVFDLLEKSGYDGWIGAEYMPSTEKTEDSLEWFQRFK